MFRTVFPSVIRSSKLRIQSENYIKYMVRTQLYIITQISRYNYMFRPCILAIVSLYYKLKK
jgi:hypothetical protein